MPRPHDNALRTPRGWSPHGTEGSGPGSPTRRHSRLREAPLGAGLPARRNHRRRAAGALGWSGAQEGGRRSRALKSVSSSHPRRAEITSASVALDRLRASRTVPVQAKPRPARMASIAASMPCSCPSTRPSSRLSSRCTRSHGMSSGRVPSLHPSARPTRVSALLVRSDTSSSFSAAWISGALHPGNAPLSAAVRKRPPSSRQIVSPRTRPRGRPGVCTSGTSTQTSGNPHDS